MARKPVRRRRRSRARRQASPGPEVYLALGPALTMGAGLAGYFVVLRPKQIGAATFEWPEVPCRILESEVQRHENTHQFEVVYQYEVDGRSYQSDQAAVGLYASSSDQPFEFAQRFPADSETVCYVDPADPFHAVLVQGSVAPIWLSFFFLAFAGAGVLCLVEGLRQLRKKRAALREDPAEPLPPVR